MIGDMATILVLCFGWFSVGVSVGAILGRRHPWTFFDWSALAIAAVYTALSLTRVAMQSRVLPGAGQ